MGGKTSKQEKTTPPPATLQIRLLISLISTKLPDRPWRQTATAFFFQKVHTYDTVADNFSVYTDLAVLSLLSDSHVFQKLKSILAGCDIPKFFTEGCGPYISTSYACVLFAENLDLFF